MAKASTVGLDIGTTRVRAVELEHSGSGGPTLSRYGEVPLPPGAVRDGEVNDIAVVADALKALWTQAKFTSKDVNIGVGNQRVVVREIDVPRMPASQVRAALPYQVQELLPMPLDEALLDFFPTGEGQSSSGPTLKGMLVAATRDTVNASIMAVESAGLRPRLVDLDSFALLRALARGQDARGTVAVVEIGARTTHVIVATDGLPRFVRILAGGGQNVTDAVAAALNVDVQRAEEMKRHLGIGATVPPELAAAGEAIGTVVTHLVEAVRNTFTYFAANNGGQGVDRLLLTGGGSHLPGLGQYLSSATRLPAAFGDPLAGLTVGKQVDTARVRDISSLVALPVGLAYGVAA